MDKSKNTETYEITLKIARLAVLTSVAIASVMLLIVFKTGVLPNDETGDVRNWVSLVIEIALAIFIGIAILIYSNNEQKKFKIQQQELTKIVDAINEMIKEQKQSQERRRSFVIDQMQLNLSFCQDFVPTRMALEKYNPEEKLEPYEPSIFDEMYYAAKSLEQMRDIVNLHADVLDPEDTKRIIILANYSQDLIKRNNVTPQLLNIADNIHRQLDELLKKFPRVDWLAHQDRL